MGFLSNLAPERKLELLGVLILAGTALLFLVLATDGYQGDSRRPLTELEAVPNALGTWGAFVAGFLYILVGQAAHVIYILSCIWGMMLLRHQPVDRLATRMAGFVLLICATAGLIHVDFAIDEAGSYPGGAVGAFVASLFEPTFGIAGVNVISVALMFMGLLLATEFLFVRLVHSLVHAGALMVRSAVELNRDFSDAMKARKERRAVSKRRRRKRASESVIILEDVVLVPPTSKAQIPKPSGGDDLSRIRVREPVQPVEQELPFNEVPETHVNPGPEVTMQALDLEDRSESIHERVEPFDGDGHRVVHVEPSEPCPDPARSDEPILDAAPATEPSVRPASKRSARHRMRRKTVIEELPADYNYPSKYTGPSLDMLEPAPIRVHTNVAEALRQTGRLLEETLQTFGIQARVTDVTRGPTITRFEVEPAPGVKVSRFMSLADDLALALKAHRVRVEAPIPGKGKVGIEVPSEFREAVVVRELLESSEFRGDEGQLTLALGKDIAGDVLTADLATMPHLLVAGATGSGKTVCVKTILASLLFSKTPEELQLLLIDPKMVELSIFNDIPHLITPVVIDPKKASTSLTWLINEMEERYRLFAHLRVRNIEVYNDSVESGEIEIAEPNENQPDSISIVRKLPYIVCIIDELADLMMLARAEVEDAIARLAQLARAVGIHLIIATQRPSVDVLTGVIKANFPARMSFQVSSRVDSRCILDEIGAERLIGRGDMLYLPAGQSKPTRVQAGFVSDEEMNGLIAYLKTQAPPQYRDEIENFGKQQETKEDLLNEDDELLDDAVRVVIETGQASISMVQRRLRVGYTRAARLVDMMEVKGIVGPHVGSKAREILVPTSHNTGEVA